MPPTFTPLAQAIDTVCDREGIDPAHVRRFPDLLDELGLEPEDIDEELANEARRAGYAALQAIADRYGGFISRWH